VAPLWAGVGLEIGWENVLECAAGGGLRGPKES